jgi:hypothetical protein
MIMMLTCYGLTADTHLLLKIKVLLEVLAQLIVVNQMLLKNNSLTLKSLTVELNMVPSTQLSQLNNLIKIMNQNSYLQINDLV